MIHFCSPQGIKQTKGHVTKTLLKSPILTNSTKIVIGSARPSLTNMPWGNNNDTKNLNYNTVLKIRITCQNSPKTMFEGLDMLFKDLYKI